MYSCISSQRKVGILIVRLLFFVFGLVIMSRPLERWKVLLIVTVCFSKSISAGVSASNSAFVKQYLKKLIYFFNRKDTTEPAP